MSGHLALAADLIGRPWRRGAAGPDAFNCWGLVRYWMHQVHGIDMSDIAVHVDDAQTEDADTSQAAAIMQAARAGGWRPVASGGPLADDIALMLSDGSGLRHVGVLLRANGTLCLLHCEGTPTNPAPGVLCEPLADVLRRYHGLQLWRRA